MPALRRNLMARCLFGLLLSAHAFEAAAEERLLTVEKIEVTQAVQSLDQDVTLIAGKPTVVRVYLSLAGAGPLTVRGKLSGTAQPPLAEGLESSNEVRFSVADNLTLQQKRLSEARSLNFLLPAHWRVEGALKLAVSELFETGGSPLACANCSTQSAEVKFERDVPLLIRLIGIRYRHEGSEIVSAPSEKDFRLTESWLRRAYPVGQVIASRSYVDSGSPWPFDCNYVNAQISAMRGLDISGGVDPRTHYYGIVHDSEAQSFMRGCASGIPASAEPSTVASGPAGNHDFGWDLDGSYADWYTGHELGHTFGRKHPGFCTESPDDASYPYPKGSISDGDKYVGWDFGDPVEGIKMQALEGTEWHDVMTYCDRQWVSQYTYLGIRARLIAEEKLAAGPAGSAGPAVAGEPSAAPEASPAPSGSSSGRGLTASGAVQGQGQTLPEGQGQTLPEAQAAAPAEPGGADSPAPAVRLEEGSFVNVIATVNLTRKTGKILYVNPVTKGYLPSEGLLRSPATIRLRGIGDEPDADIAVAIKRDTDRNESGDETGLVDALVPLSSKYGAIEVYLDGALMDSKTFGRSAPQVTQLQIDTRESEARRGLAIFRRSEKGPAVLQWAGADQDGDSVTYSVQRSRNLGKTWETIAVGLRKPTLELDEDPRESATGTMFRIIASDGMNSTYTTTAEPVRKDPE